MKYNFRIGLRIIKTSLAVLIVILFQIMFLLIDNALNLDYENSWITFSKMYTPFFAGIAAVYALHKNNKSSLKQARIRTNGSIIGGYFGMIIILITEFLLINIINLYESNYILYLLITYVVVGLGIIPLISITINFKQNDAVFITCLTYLSVTISIRNGGMPIVLFATNRVLSTLIGVGVSLLINNIYIFKKKNKNILFTLSFNDDFLVNDTDLSPYVNYKLNHLYYCDIPLSITTTRSISSLKNIFNDVEINYPMVLMNGATVYDFTAKEFNDIHLINQETENALNESLKKFNMQAFIYTINENKLQCYHNIVKNEGESIYYNNRKSFSSYTFVRGELPSDLNPVLYVIIDTKDNIEKLINYLKDTGYYNNVDVVSYHYHNEYYYLKLNEVCAGKEVQIDRIYKKNNHDKLISFISHETDLEVLKRSDLTFCFDNAPDTIKSKVDYIINHKTPEKVLSIFYKIYHSHNYNKTINKYKKIS